MRILFVCTGNICRSPTAEAIMRARIKAAGLPFETASAGTHGYHIGDPPDRRSCEIALHKGLDMSALRAKQVISEDFERFDCILAMDQGHLAILQRLCPPDHQAKLGLFLAAAGLSAEEGFDVPDPYYGGMDGFQAVYRLIERGVDLLLVKYNTLK